jgi:hypothetical protein
MFNRGTLADSFRWFRAALESRNRNRSPALLCTNVVRTPRDSSRLRRARAA